MRTLSPRRDNALSIGGARWRFWFPAVAAAVAFSLVGQGVSASAEGLQRGELKISLAKSQDGTVHLAWNGPVAAPMASKIREAFEDRKEQASRFVLLLSSNGGSVAEGERVIEVLRQIKKTHSLDTAVTQGERCASMCVFIYVQGQKRYGALTSAWLFHEVSRKDPVTKQITLDRNAWERLVDKYFPAAGVSQDWTAKMKQLTIETDYWQTGADLVQANSGIIHLPLGNQQPRNIARASPPEQAKSTQPRLGSAVECKKYIANIGAVLPVPCSR